MNINKHLPCATVCIRLAALKDYNFNQHQWPTKARLTNKNGHYALKQWNMGLPTVRLEGLEPGPEAETIAQRFVSGELSEEEYELAIKELALSIIRNGR